MRVDLNCDMGEGFGAYVIGQDELILEHITSANIACGFHAGDPSTMVNTVKMALEKRVAIGAHPGYPDLAGFGRRLMQMSPKEVYDIVLYQVSALAGIAKALGGTLQHVKPHGALYNTAAQNKSLARAVAEAAYDLNPELILIGLANSHLIKEAQNIGLRYAQEVFADRTYLPNGKLTPRNEPHAVIYDSEKALEQVIRMVAHQEVTALDGTIVPIQADTICIHGDHPTALEFVIKLKNSLTKAGIQVEALCKREV